ncbi:MAG: formate/nitrite transporter family protein [Acidimicrobiales bacterium]
MADADQAETAGIPQAQYLAPEVVLLEMGEAGAKRSMSLSALQVMILAIMAGAFITAGALFSTLIAAGYENEATQRLLEGFGFSVGFFLVILSGCLLFTEVNVELPATLLNRNLSALRSSVFRLWILAFIGNFIGAFVLGALINYIQSYGDDYEELLTEVVAAKLRYKEIGGFEGFFQAMLSGVVANWLVGMAAFLATMGRTILGKYIVVLLTVMVFVAGGFLHSPANMGYFSLFIPLGTGLSWGDAIAWGIIPAAIGNVLGAFFLVALPFLVASSHFRDKADQVDA